MCNDPSRIIVTEVPCDACSTPTVQVHHQDFPELRIEGTSAEQAASHLADRLTNDLDTVSDSSHREAAQIAIDDARAFLDRGEAASPRPTRDVSKPSTS